LNATVHDDAAWAGSPSTREQRRRRRRRGQVRAWATTGDAEELRDAMSLWLTAARVDDLGRNLARYLDDCVGRQRAGPTVSEVMRGSGVAARLPFPAPPELPAHLRARWNQERWTPILAAVSRAGWIRTGRSLQVGGRYRREGANRPRPPQSRPADPSAGAGSIASS